MATADVAVPNPPTYDDDSAAAADDDDDPPPTAPAAKPPAAVSCPPACCEMVVAEAKAEARWCRAAPVKLPPPHPVPYLSLIHISEPTRPY